MSSPNDKNYWPAVILALCGASLVYAARRVLLPFCVAFALAYLLDPLVDRLEKSRLALPRTAAVILLMSLVFSMFFLAGAILLPVMEMEAAKLAADIPKYLKSLEAQAAPAAAKLFAVDAERLQEILRLGVGKMGELPAKALARASALLWSSLSGLAGLALAAVNAVAALVALFYLLRDFDRLTEKFLNLAPRRYQEKIRGVLLEIDGVLSRFIRGQLMAATLLAVLYAAGLFAAGAPMGIFIGAAAGYASLVPYLGLALGWLPAVVLTYLHYQTWPSVLSVTMVFAAVQALEAAVITPRFVGASIGLHPVAVMIAILLGGEFLGFLGVLTAVPAAAAGNVLLRRALAWYRASDYYAA